MMRKTGTKLQLASTTARNWVGGLAKDRQGLTVSAVILIGILVVAVAAFGLIAADKIGDAGQIVEDVEF